MHNINDKKLPPFSEENEMAVLGSVLIDNKQLDFIKEILKPEHFYFSKHSIIYATMLDMGEEINYITLQGYLESKKEIEKVGGLSYLVELSGIVPTANHAMSYAKQVQKDAGKRSLLNLCDEVQGWIYAGKPYKDVLRKFDAIKDEVSLTSIEDAYGGAQLCDIYQKDYVTRGENGIGVKTGIKEVDILWVNEKKKLDIIAARPSIGKSAVAQQLALGVAQTNQPSGDYGKALLLSCEMSETELMDRMCAMITGEDNLRFKHGTADTLNEAMAVIEEIGENFRMKHTPKLTLSSIQSFIIKEKRRNGLDMLIIDYLGILGEPKQKSENEVNWIGRITSTLKMFAGMYNINIKLLAQMNREIKSNQQYGKDAPKAQPQLEHLRGSGSIEQDADQVIMIDRERDADSGMFYMRKNRGGELQSLPFTWKGETTSFTIGM